MSRGDTINIIGAGPAGLTAAIVLAKNGFKARVYEMAPEVGHRLNGDFQGLENWSTEQDITGVLRQIGIETGFLCAPYYRGTVYDPDGKAVSVTSKRPIFYLVQRGSTAGTLDRGLKEQALSAGVEILFNRRLETFTEPAIVGTGPKGADAVAVGVTFRTGMEDQAAVVLNDRIAPKGYAYLLVHRGEGTLAAVLYREFRREKEYFTRAMRFFSERTRLDIRNEKQFGCYVNFFLRDTAVHGRKLYVGESAGFQDQLWGFGMRYAVLSGYLAARSSMDGLDYDVLWKRELMPMLETSIVNRYLFEKFGHAGYRYLVKRFGNGNPCGYLRNQYNGSFFKRLLLPLARKKYESRERRDLQP